MGIEDTGSTANPVAPGTFENESEEHESILVTIPNRTKLQSTHHASLNIKNILEKVNKVHILEGLGTDLIILIPQLCHDRCMAIRTQHKQERESIFNVYISFKINNKHKVLFFLNEASCY